MAAASTLQQPIDIADSDDEKVNVRVTRSGAKRRRKTVASTTAAYSRRAKRKSDLKDPEVVILVKDTPPSQLQAGSSKEPWSCERCTLENEENIEHCRACGAARVLGDNAWTCKCKVLNSATVRLCSACGTRRSDAGQFSGPASQDHEAPLILPQPSPPRSCEAGPSEGSKCKLCNGDAPVDALFSADVCGHRFCQACIQALVNKKLTEREALLSSVLKQFICPAEGCGKPLSRRDILGLSGPQKLQEYEAWLAPILRQHLQKAEKDEPAKWCSESPTCSTVAGLKNLPTAQVRALLKHWGLESTGRAPELTKRLQAAIAAATECEWTLSTSCFTLACSVCGSDLIKPGKPQDSGLHVCPYQQVVAVACHLAEVEQAYAALCGSSKTPEKPIEAAKGKRGQAKVPKHTKSVQDASPFECPGAKTVWAKGTGFGGYESEIHAYWHFGRGSAPAVSGPSIAEVAAQEAERKVDEFIRNASDALTRCLSGPVALAAGNGVMPFVSLPVCSLLLSGSFARILRTLLHNDSLMDVSKRRDLYCSLLLLVRTVASHMDLLPILCCPPPQEIQSPPGGGTPALPAGSQAETVLSELEKLNTQAKLLLQGAQASEMEVEDEDDTLDVGLALEVKDVFEIVQGSSECWLTMQPKKDMSPPGGVPPGEVPPAAPRTRRGTRSEARSRDKGKGKLEEAPPPDPAAESAAYKAALKPQQFSMCDLKAKGHFDHYFRAEVDKAIDKNGAHSHKRTLRVSKEVASLSTTLPLEWESSIHIRVDQERMDLLKALIIGPHGTPYANGLFMFDIFLPPDYPNSSPKVHFLTTGGGTVRFNPNLYNCGKVCLSLLGTWAGPGWDPSKSTVLQVLVSIQSLIFVQDPYYNEPGFEASGTTAASERYNATQRHNTLLYAILPQLEKPTPVFEDVIQTHFKLKKREIIDQCERWASLKSSAPPKPRGKALTPFDMGIMGDFTGPNQQTISKAAKTVKDALARY